MACWTAANSSEPWRDELRPTHETQGELGGCSTGSLTLRAFAPGWRRRTASAVMTEATVDVVSVYGEVNAGVRARALEWLGGTQHRVRLASYFGTASAGASQFMRYPHRAALAELHLRRMSGDRRDAVLLIREASPLSRGRAEERALRAARHGVYDLDDALYHDVRGRLFEQLFSKSSKAARAAAAADTVIVGNEYLADWAAAHARDVRVIPTCVEPRRYATKSEYATADPPRVVWMGTPSGERYLADIHRPLQRLNEAYGARLVIVGSPRPTLGAMERLIDRVPWRLDEAYAGLRAYDLGIMPLPDSRYERGKCAYKLLEYGAAALPVVASPVGVNARILADAGCEAPTGEEEWFGSLERMIAAPASERQSAGDRLLHVVQQQYSFDAWRTRWFDAVLPGSRHAD
jgi:glycosyltransferase involved in cell wall biosynthesis